MNRASPQLPLHLFDCDQASTLTICIPGDHLLETKDAKIYLRYMVQVLARELWSHVTFFLKMTVPRSSACRHKCALVVRLNVVVEYPGSPLCCFLKDKNFRSERGSHE